MQPSMLSGGAARIPVDVTAGLVGAWKETYRWIPAFGAFLAFGAAFFTGANNIPIPFSTSVGSGVMTLLHASVAALLINVPGATFASNGTVDAALSDLFQDTQPSEGFMMWSLVAVLLTTTTWLALATLLELPVSTQMSMQSALLGTRLVTGGVHVMPIHDKHLSRYFSVLRVTVEWMAAPVIACAIGFCFFGFLKLVVLRREDGQKKILIFLPICYAVSVGLLCLSLMYQVVSYIAIIETSVTILAVMLATLTAALLTLLVVVPLARKRLEGIEKPSISSKMGSPQQSYNNDLELVKNVEEVEIEEALKEYMGMRVLQTIYEEDEMSYRSPERNPESTTLQDKSTSSFEIHPHSTSFKHLLESTPNRLVHARNFRKIHKTSMKDDIYKYIRDLKDTTFFPTVEYDRHTLIRHALAEKYDEKMEELLSFPHILASLTFALTQSVNEIALVVRPYGVILDIFDHRNKYSGNGETGDLVQVVWWIRAMGGFTASIGFFLCGWRLTQCLGGKLTYMSNSRGLSSQLCAVATMLMATSLELPISSSLSFIGSMVGVGIADDFRNVNWKLFLKFLCGWIGTIIFCFGFAYGLYSFTIHSPSYVVP